MSLAAPFEFGLDEVLDGAYVPPPARSRGGRRGLCLSALRTARLSRSSDAVRLIDPGRPDEVREGERVGEVTEPLLSVWRDGPNERGKCRVFNAVGIIATES